MKSVLLMLIVSITFLSSFSISAIRKFFPMPGKSDQSFEAPVLLPAIGFLHIMPRSGNEGKSVFTYQIYIFPFSPVTSYSSAG